MLQFGGVQDAVIAAEPAWEVVTVQVVPAAHPVVEPPADSAAGSEETQVSGGLGAKPPCTTTAGGVRVLDGPLFAQKRVGVLVWWAVNASWRGVQWTGAGS